MTSQLVVIGAGGFGREVLDVVDAINRVKASWEVIGVVDDGPSDQNLRHLALREVAYLGTVEDLARSEFSGHYVIGVGSGRARQTVARRIEGHGVAATLIHPAASVGFDVRVGAGSVICAGGRVTTNIELGRHVHIDTNATVGHDTTVGDFARLNPSSSVSGDCVLGEGVAVGVGARIINQLHIGDWATVGAGACVVTSVEAGTTVVGVPARAISEAPT